MRVLILSSERALCDQLSQALASNGCCATSQNSFNFVRSDQEKVDCLVFDFGSWRRDGVAKVKELRARMGLIPIFAINVRASSLDRVGVIEAGADDCLPEPLSIPELIIRLKILLHRSTATRKQNAFTKNRSFGLTKTECRVAELIADGRKVDQIAAELHVSRNTVRSHLRGIFNKTGVRRQVELMLLLLTHWNSNTVADLPSRLNPSSARLEDEVRAEGTRYASWPPAS